MWIKQLPITTLSDLLAILYPNECREGRTTLVVKTYQPGNAEVHEWFDATDLHFHPLEWEVFMEAREAGYLVGVQKEGHVSSIEFIHSDSRNNPSQKLLSHQYSAKEEAVI